MVGNDISKVTYLTQGTASVYYSVPFQYTTNSLGTPELRVVLDGNLLEYGVDFEIGSSGLRLLEAPEVGKLLVISRGMSFTQEIDFQTGIIDPDEIENAVDRSVLRDQELLQRIEDMEQQTITVAFSDILGSPEDNDALHASLNEKASSAALETHIDNANIHVTVAEKDMWDNKQEHLTAGENIRIVNNVISAVGSGTITDVKVDGSSVVSGTVASIDLSGKQNALSSAQLSAVNSGIDSSKVAAIASNTSAISSLSSSKQDKLTAGSNITINGSTISASQPVVGNGVLTLKQNGVLKGTFSANQSGDLEVDFTGGGSGGATRLSALDDVNVSTVVDGQILAYDAENERWTNATNESIQVPADWNQTDTTAVDYIKNKPTKVSDFTNDSGFQTSTQVANSISTHNSSSSAHSSLFGAKQDVISDLSTIRSGATAGATAVQPSDLATVATSGSYNDLSNKPTIPVVPTNVSDFTNDANYQNNTQVSSAISTHNSSNDAHSDIRTLVAGKQDILTAGTNITIVDNVISAVGGSGSYTAGKDITITNNEIACSLDRGSGTNAIAFGGLSGATASYSMAFGYNAVSSASRAVQIGSGTNTASNTLSFGNTNGNFEVISADGTIPFARIQDLVLLSTTSTSPSDSSVYSSLKTNNLVSAVQTSLSTHESSSSAHSSLFSAKANDSAVVHLAGTETITGGKTFNGTATFNGSVSLGSSASATTPTSETSTTRVATIGFINNKFQEVSALPASPDPNVWYAIPEE